MATSKLNKEQYANIGSFAGIMLVYNSTNKDGELVQTAQHFFGADFEPADKSDNEIFRVIKNMVATIDLPQDLHNLTNIFPMKYAIHCTGKYHQQKYDIEDRLLFIFHLSSFLSSFQVYLLFFLSDADRSAIHLSVC